MVDMSTLLESLLLRQIKIMVQLLFIGRLFIVFDLLSGPISLLLDLSNLLHEEHVEITVADIFLLLRIFCLERIRLLIKDVFHILYVSRQINLSLALAFYLYSYIAFRLFQKISPKYFRNVFISMLSMFQVLTLDSWNLQVNQSVTKHYGQIWSLFFIFFIIFMFFYFINLLLGAFVSYYSNPNLRQNFDYDYGHDDILNPELNEEYRQTVEIAEALNLLDLKEDNLEQLKLKWGLGRHEIMVYIFTVLQIILEAFQIYHDINILILIFEEAFGVYFSVILIQKLDEYRTFKQQTTNNIDEITYEDREQQNEEQTIRVYILGILFLSGPVALGLDILTLIFNNGSFFLQYGPGFRILILLAIQCVKKAIFKFVEVLPGVSHIILFVAGILFSFCLIGHQFLSDVKLEDPTFDTMTNTYLFLLMVITFDSWGDVARTVIKEKGFWYVLYFLFLTVFVGFFLLNMLVGIMATMTQPKTQELFEKEHILRQRVNKAAVSQLKQQIETYKNSKNIQKEDEIENLKQILDDFNQSTDKEDKLFIYIGGQQFEITTKHFIVFDDEQ